MTILNWNTTGEENQQIEAILDRFYAILKGAKVKAFSNTERRAYLMDLMAAHCNGCPLDFAAMLAGSDRDLVHDVCGINRHVNRSTGALENCFVPRFAKKYSRASAELASSESAL